MSAYNSYVDIMTKLHARVTVLALQSIILDPVNILLMTLDCKCNTKITVEKTYMDMLNKMLIICVNFSSFKYKIKLKWGMLVQGNKPRKLS